MDKILNFHRIRSFAYVYFQVPQLSWDYQSLYRSEHDICSYNENYVTGFPTI
jgi:hypothetical protein